MSTRHVDLRFFEINVGLQSSLTIFAGATQQDARNGRYRTDSAAPRAVFEEILQKLADAIHTQSRTISVNVESDRWIVRDATFGMSAMSAEISQLRDAINTVQLSLDSSAKPPSKSRKSTKSSSNVKAPKTSRVRGKSVENAKKSAGTRKKPVD